MTEQTLANDLMCDLQFVADLQRSTVAIRVARELEAAWKACIAGMDGLDRVRPVIRASWLRSRAAGIAADEFHYEFVDSCDLARRLEAQRELLDIAAPIMADLLRYNPNGHLNLADAEGVTLAACGVDLTPLGSRLLESVQGTNCTGLALREQRLVFVLAGENFKRELRERRMHCASAPVRDTWGRLLGALGISGPMLRLGAAEAEAIAPVVVEEARALSRLLGA